MSPVNVLCETFSSPRMLLLMQLITLIAISGALLSTLFPLGLWNIHSIPFHAVFLLHLGVHLYALIVSCRKIFCTLNTDRTGRLVGLLALAPVLITLIALSTLPVTHRDALIHHLAVPSWWLTAGNVHDIWWHQWSSYPMLIQLAYAEFLSWDLPQLTTLYQSSYLLLFAGLLAERKDQQGSNRYAQLGVLLVCTIPLFVRLGSAPYVDLPLAVYGLAFFLGWFSDSEPNRRSALMLGILLGLMAATKYNGLLFAGVAAPLFLFTQRKNALLFLAGAGLTSIPWYLKNWLTHVNPVYPLLPGIFPPQTELLHVPRTGNLEQHLAGPLSAPLEFLSLPFQMMTFGRDNDPTGFDGILSPLLLFFLIPPVQRKHRRSYYTGLFLIITVAYLTLILSGPRTRYFAPLFGILVYLALFGIERSLSLCRPLFQKWIITAIIGCQVILGLWYCCSLAIERDLFRYYTREMTSSEYLNQRVSESLLADAVNEKLPENSKTYLLYTGNRYFLYKRPVINSGYFAERLLLTWLNESTSVSELKERIDTEQITHFAIHTARYTTSFARFAETGFLSEEKVLLWNSFTEKHLAPLYEIGPYQLWQIQ